MELKDVLTGAGRVPDQNLINQTREEYITGTPGFWKSIIVDLFSVLSALFFGYSYFGYLVMGMPAWYLFGAFLLVSLFSVLQVYLARSASRRSLVIFGESLAFAVFFISYDDWTMLLASVVVAYVLLSWGYFMGRADAGNAMEVQFFKTTRSVLSSVATGLLLVMILIYVPQVQGKGAFISEANFRKIFTFTAGLVGNLYPGVSFGGSYGDLSQSFVQNQFQGNTTFQEMTLTQKNAAVEDAVTQLTGSIEKSTGITPAASEPVSDVAYRAIVALFASWQDQFRERFTIVWVIVVFLALRTVATVFVWIAQFVSLVAYEALIAMGFMHIQSFTQTKEEVGY
jgi:hypothetical protein